MKVYLVRWLHDYFYSAKHREGGHATAPPVQRIVKMFIDPREAEAFRQNLQKGVQIPPLDANPFVGFWERPIVTTKGTYTYMEKCEFRGLENLTSMPELIFNDWLCDLGLTPPENAKSPNGWKRDWLTWWEANSPRMTDHQRMKIWQALDKLQFYEIVETELEE